MAFKKSGLTSLARPIRLSATQFVRFQAYATNDTKAEVLTAGYFNDARADLSVGSIAMCSVDNDGTPGYVLIMFSAVPSSGNVTVTDITGDTTPD